MSEMEMAIEALKKCVGPDAFAKAMREIQGGTAVEQTVPESVPSKLTAEPVTRSLLREVGIPTHIKGYRYTVTGIVLLINNPGMADAIIKELYPSIAEVHDTTASRVERAIRHGVEVAWNRGDMDVLKEYFGNTVSSFKGKPTNSEFLTRMAEAVQEEMAK